MQEEKFLNANTMSGRYGGGDRRAYGGIDPKDIEALKATHCTPAEVPGRLEELSEVLDRVKEVVVFEAIRSFGDFRPVLVVPCSQAKKKTAGPAINVYDGPLFRSLRKWKPAIDVIVLSAKHGFIPAEKEIEPYDKKFRKLEVTGSGIVLPSGEAAHMAVKARYIFYGYGVVHWIAPNNTAYEQAINMAINARINGFLELVEKYTGKLTCADSSIYLTWERAKSYYEEERIMSQRRGIGYTAQAFAKWCKSYPSQGYIPKWHDLI